MRELAYAYSRRRATESCFEEIFHAPQDFGRSFGLVDFFAQVGAAGDAVREPRRELLHFADGVGEFLFDQHLEVGADHLVAVEFGGVVVERA